MLYLFCSNLQYLWHCESRIEFLITFFCVRWKKKLFWRYKLWLSWKQCVILAWCSHTWVAQTCESAKQTIRIASAVTIWERSWTLSIFCSLKSGHMVEPPFCWCSPQTGLSGSVSSSPEMKKHWVTWTGSRNKLSYAIGMNNRYVLQPYKSPKAFAFAASVYSNNLTVLWKKLSLWIPVETSDFTS